MEDAEVSVNAGDFGDGTPEEVETVIADAFGGADEEDDTAASLFFEASLMNLVLVNTAVGFLAVVDVAGDVDLDTLEALEIVAGVIGLVAGVTGLAADVTRLVAGVTGLVADVTRLAAGVTGMDIKRGLLACEEATVLETSVIEEMVAEELLVEVIEAFD